MTSADYPPVAVGEADTEDVRPRDVPEKRLFRVLGIVAAIAVAAAVLANWFQARTNAADTGSGGTGVIYAPPAMPVNLEKAPKDMLPGDVLGFESMAIQPVPGQRVTAAEGIYATTDMKLDMQVSTGSYARVEGFATAAQASDRVKEVLGQYPVGQHNFMLNSVTPVRIGYTKDQGAWAAVWSSGQYAILVKSFFKDNVPAEKRDFLNIQGMQLAAAVEAFNRTGTQGVAAQKHIKAPPPGAAGSGSGIGTLPRLGAP